MYYTNTFGATELQHSIAGKAIYIESVRSVNVLVDCNSVYELTVRQNT